MKEYSTVIGLDLSDKTADLCMLDFATGEVIEQGKIVLTKSAVTGKFSAMSPTLVIFETGTHSPWLQHTLEALGHAAVVADARRLRMISDNDRKCDKHDAMLLARLYRADPKLLSVVSHRGREAQTHFATIKARESLVRTRARTISVVRGLVKSLGDRLEDCSTACFSRRSREQVPRELRAAVWPLLDTLEHMDKSIKDYDAKIELICAKCYPETKILRTVRGVGPITALTFVLVLENTERFRHARDAAAYLGLVPRLDQSGASNPQLRITKSGNTIARRLLVQCAQYILTRGDDSQLRRWGIKLAARGNQRNRKRAVVALARKLAVVLFSMWKNNTEFDPFHGMSEEEIAEATAQATEAAPQTPADTDSDAATPKPAAKKTRRAPAAATKSKTRTAAKGKATTGEPAAATSKGKGKGKAKTKAPACKRTPQPAAKASAARGRKPGAAKQNTKDAA